MSSATQWCAFRAYVRPVTVMERLGAGLVRVALRDGHEETRIVNEARIFATRRQAHAARDKGVRVA